MAESDGVMDGKVCLVTGATSGIGEITARELARMGATVVLVGRSPEKCEQTTSRIREQTANAQVSHLVADLSSQAEVRRLAGEFLERFDRLDVLINNAGAMFMERRESVDGIELTFALNHLAYFLLTSLLLDRLKASTPARVVNVSSDAHRSVKLDVDDLQSRSRYRGFQVYSRSKLANVLFTRELARRIKGSGVTANALHPGFVATGFFSGDGPAWWVMRRLTGLFAISPESGATTSVYLATSPDVEGVTGAYFSRCKQVQPSQAAQDDAMARKLWELSAEMVGLKDSPPS